jgi:hypothetical protein
MKELRNEARGDYADAIHRMIEFKKALEKIKLVGKSFSHLNKGNLRDYFCGGFSGALM